MAAIPSGSKSVVVHLCIKDGCDPFGIETQSTYNCDPFGIEQRSIPRLRRHVRRLRVGLTIVSIWDGSAGWQRVSRLHFHSCFISQEAGEGERRLEAEGHPLTRRE